MKLASIVVLLTLIVLVNGNWMAAAAQPAIAGLGALMVGLNQDELPETNALHLDWRKWIPWGGGKKEEVPEPKVPPKQEVEEKKQAEKAEKKESNTPISDILDRDEKIFADNDVKEEKEKKEKKEKETKKKTTAEKRPYNPN